MGVLGGSKRIVENFYATVAVTRGDTLTMLAGIHQIGDTINEGDPIPVPGVDVSANGEKVCGIALHDVPAGGYGEMVTRGAVKAKCTDTTKAVAAGEEVSAAGSGLLDDDSANPCGIALEAGDYETNSNLTWIYFDPNGMGGA
jgi:hypothetical protein